ncbi:MAG: matrixin family metalloprotease [Minisyncoccia bacterium]
MSGDAIRWWVLCFVVAIAGAGMYADYQQTRPCAEPIPYSVGAVDPRFGISSTAVLNEAEAAADIWNQAEGKTILKYDPTAALKISLIYDERQANAKIGTAIASAQANADTARTALDVAQAQFIADQQSYNQKVSEVNAHGGATPSEAAALNLERDALKQTADSINAEVERYNASIASLNAEVEQYDQTAGHTFEEGEYVQDDSGKRISVFEFVGNTQLERVLAHEFGHAIGLGHNTNPKSIMYAQNESGNLVPTADDLAALKAVCGG